ncbi:MAG: hypothetical protein ACM31E_08290 [Fibrobacterota bacterium]|nr:hypothetical protein [Chitinispirillaceae bacterium]
MFRTTALSVLLACGIGLQAQTIALKGKVTDQNSKAVAGAVVTLVTKNLKDTTDSNGEYAINAVISAAGRWTPKTSGFERITLSTGIIEANLLAQSDIKIDIYNMQGSLINSFRVPQVNAGTFRFDLTSQKLSSAMMLVRVSAGNTTTHFRYAPLSIRFHDANQGTAISGLARSADATADSDTLSVTAVGFKSKKVAITSYETTVNVTIESEYTGTCTASKKHSSSSGSGPHKVVIETNSDNGINEGTIFRPEDLGPGKNYPIFVWGQGACSKAGLSNAGAMSEIASHGYFVIADGTPNGSGTRNMDLATMSKVGRAYATWIIAENKKPCSAYYQSIDTSKLAASGFSCGGFLGQGFASDPRTTTWGVSSSGSFGDAPDLWKSVHTPVLILEGSKDISSAGGTGAYDNGKRDYNGITALGKPAYFISNKNMGHGGDLGGATGNGGEFTKINLAWLNWWLKGDTGATGKGVLMGSTCKYCTNSNWEIKSANIQ